MGLEVLALLVMTIALPFVAVGFAVHYRARGLEKARFESVWESFSRARGYRFVPASGEWPNVTSARVECEEPSGAKMRLDAVLREGALWTRLTARPSALLLGRALVSTREGRRAMPKCTTGDAAFDAVFVSSEHRGQYDSKAFQKSVGLNGVGTKAVNALSNYFKVTAIREGIEKTAEFERGVLIKEYKEAKTGEENGTLVTFIPDETVFKNFKFIPEFLENQIWNYCFLNAGLKIIFNGKSYVSKNGLLDLLQRKTNEDEIRYPIIHLKGNDIEIALSHTNEYGEDIYSFVNGQHTTQGGTHQQAFREAYVKTIRDFFKKDYDASDIRTGIVAAATSVRVVEPVFESQTKTKLGSINVDVDGPSMRQFVGDFLSKELDNYLHKNPSRSLPYLRQIIDDGVDGFGILIGTEIISRQRWIKLARESRESSSQNHFVRFS